MEILPVALINRILNKQSKFLNRNSNICNNDLGFIKLSFQNMLSILKWILSVADIYTLNKKNNNLNLII